MQHPICPDLPAIIQTAKFNQNFINCFICLFIEFTGTPILTCMVYHSMVEKGNFSYFEHRLYQFVVSLKKRASKQEFKTNMFFCWLHIPICIRMPSLLSLAVEVFRKLNQTRKLRKKTCLSCNRRKLLDKISLISEKH